MAFQRRGPVVEGSRDAVRRKGPYTGSPKTDQSRWRTVYPFSPLALFLFIALTAAWQFLCVVSGLSVLPAERRLRESRLCFVHCSIPGA